MYELRWVRIISIFIGIAFILYGWTESWNIGGDSTFINLGNEGISSTIRFYVFVISGSILIFIGALLGAVMKHIHSLEERIYREMRNE